MTERYRACAVDELEAGESKVVEVNNVPIGILNIDGEFHAMVNNCPHQNGPVCEGKVKKKLVGEFTGLGEQVEMKYTDDYTISCPWHGWEFDVESGVHLGDESVKVPTYDVVVEDGVVYIEP